MLDFEGIKNIIIL